MKWIKLNQVCGQVPADNGEDDGIHHIGTREMTRPLVLAIDQVRSFTPRREPRVGTRISYRNGAAVAVTETFDVVEAMIVS